LIGTTLLFFPGAWSRPPFTANPGGRDRCPDGGRQAHACCRASSAGRGVCVRGDQQFHFGCTTTGIFDRLAKMRHRRFSGTHSKRKISRGAPHCNPSDYKQTFVKNIQNAPCPKVGNKLRNNMQPNRNKTPVINAIRPSRKSRRSRRLSCTSRYAK
jgi:hypothetical protein